MRGAGESQKTSGMWERAKHKETQRKSAQIKPNQISTLVSCTGSWNAKETLPFSPLSAPTPKSMYTDCLLARTSPIRRKMWLSAIRNVSGSQAAIFDRVVRFMRCAEMSFCAYTSSFFSHAMLYLSRNVCRNRNDENTVSLARPAPDPPIDVLGSGCVRANILSPLAPLLLLLFTFCRIRMPTGEMLVELQSSYWLMIQYTNACQQLAYVRPLIRFASLTEPVDPVM